MAYFVISYNIFIIIVSSFIRGWCNEEVLFVLSWFDGLAFIALCHWSFRLLNSIKRFGSIRPPNSIRPRLSSIKVARTVRAARHDLL